MPYQSAVTIRAQLCPGTPAETLHELSRHQPPSMAIAFDRMQNVHSARVFMIPEAEDLSGRPVAASIIYAADVDGPVRRHLHDLGMVWGEFTDRIVSQCEGYPEVPDTGSRVAWLRR